MRGPVVVIGGANLDILGMVDRPLVPADSNPGHIRTSPGGVGRNIAENLARLGIETRFVTAPGEGADGETIARSCTEAGVALFAVPAPGLAAPRYLAITDENGDLAVAVNDMRALEAVTPGALDAFDAAIDDAAIIVLDANLAEETLVHVAERWGDRPIMLDTVSVAKGVRARGILSRLHTLKTNELEAAALACTAPGAVDAAVDSLLSAGVPRVVITGGVAGALFAQGVERMRFVPPPAHVVNATGAGDAYMAGLVYAALEELDSTHAAAFASAVASIALGSERTVGLDVSEDNALRIMEGMLS